MKIFELKKICITLFFISFTIVESLKAQNQVNTDSLLNKAAYFFDLGNETEALKLYLEVLEEQEKNFEALWRTSLNYARKGFRLEDEKEMMKHYQKALEYAEITLENYPDEGYSHFVFAIAHGRISDLSKTRTRIKKSHIVKEHATKAAELIPDYAPVWLLLGSWHSEVANISSAQKLVAGVFSKGIPDGASNEKAEKYFKKAIELNPEQTLRFKLDLARHYIRAGETQNAIEALQEVLKMKPKNEIDEWNLDRAKKILNEIQ